MIGLASQSTRTSNFYCDRQGKCTWSVWSVTWISFLDLKAPQRLRLSQMSLPWDRDATLDGCGLNFGMCHRLALPFTLQEFERTTKFVRCVFNRTLWLVYLVSICILSADLKPIRMPSQKSTEASANAQGKQRNITHLLAGSETKLFSNQRLRFHAMLHVKLRNVAEFSTLAESVANGSESLTSCSASRRPWLTFNLDAAPTRWTKAGEGKSIWNLRMRRTMRMMRMRLRRKRMRRTRRMGMRMAMKMMSWRRIQHRRKEDADENEDDQQDEDVRLMKLMKIWGWWGSGGWIEPLTNSYNGPLRVPKDPPKKRLI